MKSFRNSKYTDRYEDVVFELEQPLDVEPATYQIWDIFKFVVGKEYTSLNWYNARLLMYFKLTKLNGNRILVTDNNGIVNGSNSFVKKLVF